MDSIVAVISYFVVMCVAAERSVDIVKRLLLIRHPYLPGVTYQLLSAAFGASMAYYAPPPSLILDLGQTQSLIIVALGVSGGSSFWNSVLSSVSNFSKSLTVDKAPVA
jgi:hypothetical protein